MEREEKSKKIVLLEDNLNNILVAYDINISIKRKDILKNRANNERNINYKNLFFKSGRPTIDNYDFFKRFGTLYDLLINLLNERMSLERANEEQNEMIEKIKENFVLLEEENISKKNKGIIKKIQRRKTFSIQKML